MKNHNYDSKLFHISCKDSSILVLGGLGEDWSDPWDPSVYGADPSVQGAGLGPNSYGMSHTIRIYKLFSQR